MRFGRLTGDEILEAERTADKRRQDRNNGFSLMKERDRGFAKLRPYYSSASEVIMHWGVDDSNLFKLEIRPYKGKTIEVILDAEEVRKQIRWI